MLDREKVGEEGLAVHRQWSLELLALKALIYKSTSDSAPSEGIPCISDLPRKYGSSREDKSGEHSLS